MAERTSTYWQERFKQMEDAQHDTSIQKMQGIQEQFDRSLAAISGKINAWYQRLADNNGVSMQEARKMLDAWELKEFRWNVEEYIKHAEENDISGAWAKQLENASARVHISRLEALKIETQQEVEKLYGNCTDAIDRHIRDAYTTDFYHTAFEVQRGTGIGTAMNRLDPKTVEKIVSKPWAVDGKNFSDRLWENKTKLINNMHNSLSRMCITGEAPDRAIDEISKQMGVSKAQAGRVVMTESAVFANKARQDCMEALDVEQFEVVETLDNHTCELCGGMDGKHFRMTDFEVGVTAPPFHPNCRGCTCPYFDDEFDSVGERAARGEDGKTSYVPADTTYEEWKDQYLDKSEKAKIISPSDDQKLLENIENHDILSVEDVINKAKEFGDDILQGKENIVYDNGNPIYDYVARKLNYDALPRIVDSSVFAELEKDSPVGVIYRGIVADTQEEAKKYANDFMYGKMYAGKSYAYGSGTYFSPDKNEAEMYNNQEVMLKAILSKDAKVVKYKDIVKEYSSTGADVAKIKKGDNTEAWEDILRSVGEFAAIKGYDAIDMAGAMNKKHVIVLNRRKVVIEK